MARKIHHLIRAFAHSAARQETPYVASMQGLRLMLSKYSGLPAREIPTVWDLKNLIKDLPAYRDQNIRLIWCGIPWGDKELWDWVLANRAALEGIEGPDDLARVVVAGHSPLKEEPGQE